MTDDENDHLRELAESGDSELLSRIRAGEEDAATSLYLRYARRLEKLAENRTDRKMAVRVDPEGIVQSVFRTFFRRVTDGQYDVGDSQDLWNLLLVISLNKLRSRATRHRAAKRDLTRTIPLEPTHQNRGRGDNEEALLVLRLTVEEILGELTESECEIVRMRIEGHEVNEIASKTSRAKRSVERILQAFRKKLKDTIEE